ncbi:DUF6308 family protein [Brachybacterium muris]|uniref:DUF6308 family protein n=1 Tax=Brachybacterium muris TaxID=219301 RepID=UPI0021A4D261|nr:DUF6308 family protein [Brachybacterium muris]MCT1996854.1 DUF6308 family protein [Brachybacterium muris]
MTVKIPEKFEAFQELILDPASEAMLLGYLKEYSAGGRYTGAYFGELTTRTGSDPNRVDIADLMSLSLLQVRLNLDAIEYFLDESTLVELQKHLSAEPDRDLADLTADEAVELESGPLNDAWSLISRPKRVGETRTAKLLARKRPRLIPIWDSRIQKMLGLKSTSDYWTIFHAALTENDSALDKRLGELASEAEVAERYSRLRVLDILAWMHGSQTGGTSST